MAALPSACVIGAGSSGIAALAERGIPVECFEKSDRVGGNWVFANRNGIFPFFDDGFVSAPDNELLLYRRGFKPGVDNLFFIALLQPPPSATPWRSISTTTGSGCGAR